MNMTALFNDGWDFAKSNLEVTDSTDLKFEPVDLPHDWLIYNTLDLYENSIGWYRKRFTYKKENQETLLCFDGVYMDSSVYVNQQFVGEWKYGYSSFEHDITQALVDGENEILVKVVHQSPRITKRHPPYFIPTATKFEKRALE
jgi:beta-galactosidase